MQTNVVDLEARKRRLEIAYEEEKIAPKLVRVNHHAEITCAQITSCRMAPNEIVAKGIMLRFLFFN